MDESFLAIDIVINWIGDGMALCFFHAVIGMCRSASLFAKRTSWTSDQRYCGSLDKAPEDNDENAKTDWTNWCGTPEGLFDSQVSVVANARLSTFTTDVDLLPRRP